MCNHFYLGNRGCDDLDPAVMESMEPILPYCETVMLNGDGEPFLCPSIEQNIRRLGKYGVKIGTNTNLCYMPESVWPLIAESFGFLNISCDGGTRETFEMVRQGLKWETFTRNLARLDKAAPQLRKNLDCVVMRQNLRELPDIVELAAAYGMQAVRFHRLGVNPCIGNELDQAEYYYDILQEQLLAAQRLGQSLGVRVLVPTYQCPACHAPADLVQTRRDPAHHVSANQGPEKRSMANQGASWQSDLPTREAMAEEIAQRKARAAAMMRDASLADDYYSEAVTARDFSEGTWASGKVCQWAVERCYIDIRGNVTTCCYNMKKHMGSLKDQSFDEIWNGENYAAFRRLMAAHSLPGFCKGCNWIKESRF